VEKAWNWVEVKSTHCVGGLGRQIEIFRGSGRAEWGNRPTETFQGDRKNKHDQSKEIGTIVGFEPVQVEAWPSKLSKREKLTREPGFGCQRTIPKGGEDPTVYPSLKRGGGHVCTRGGQWGGFGGAKNRPVLGNGGSKS